MNQSTHGNQSYGTSITFKFQNNEAVRREIRLCKESIAKAAKRFNVNPKIIVKWRRREDPKDLPMGPKDRRSRVLTSAEEKAVIAFSKLTKLPLDDVLYSLQEPIADLTRCNLASLF